MSVLLYVIWARVVNVIEILLVVYAFLSWFPGAYDTSLGRIIRQIVQPILAPFRRLNLAFAGIDFSAVLGASSGSARNDFSGSEYGCGYGRKYRFK